MTVHRLGYPTDQLFFIAAPPLLMASGNIDTVIGNA
jgi:hypothetical protein